MEFLTEKQKEVLQNLQNIFPNKDVNSLIQIITQHEVPDEGNIIMEIMENDEENQNPNVNDNVEVIANLLKEYLPFVVFEFLDQKALEFQNQPMHVIQAYISEVLDDQSKVPTKKNQAKAKKTHSLTIERLLIKYPDPKEHFVQKESKVSDAYKACTRNRLKVLFPKQSAKKIDQVLAKNKWHFLPSYKDLKKARSTMKNPRVLKKFELEQFENKALAEEVFFADHETTIQEILDKKQNSSAIFECQCCFDDKVLLEDMISCDQEHMFCPQCVNRGCETAIGDSKTELKCFADCDGKFPLSSIQRVLDPVIFEKYCQRLQIEEIVAAGIQGLEHCRHCGRGNICSPNSKVFYCINEECLKHTCRLCNEDDHEGLTCEEVEKDVETKNRIMIEEKMTEALIRNCYYCNNPFMKTEGCNRMRCPNPKCRKSMCYVCRQPVQHYEHFYNTDNGGRPEPGKCPLYINEERLHAQEVQKAAKEAKKNLDPNVKLKHDPTKDVLGQEKN